MAICGMPVAVAQSANISAVAGVGVGFGERQDRGGLAAAGASVAFPISAGRRKVQLDYFLGRFTSRGENRHFVTGSYVVQFSTGGPQPFFQIGAGIGTRTLRIESQTPSGSVFTRTDVEATPILLAGGGITLK